MRTSVTSDPPTFPQTRNAATGLNSVAFGDMPVLTDGPTRLDPPPDPTGASAASFFGPGGPAQPDAAFGRAVPARVRLIDLSRGRRLAAEDEGRRVRDDPLAWLDGTRGGPADA